MDLANSLPAILTSDVAKLALAFLLAMPIALDREQETRIMGLRTFPLVALASCGFVLIGATFISPGDSDAQARLLQGIIAGIGFIGGGAILKQDDRVLGTASAASIWTTGAIGVACAYARYDIAVLLSLADFAILRWFTPLKNAVDEDQQASA